MLQLVKDENFKYKDLYYYLHDNVWYLFDEPEIGYLFKYNANTYRLDECIKLAAEEWANSIIKDYKDFIEVTKQKYRQLGIDI